MATFLIAYSNFIAPAEGGYVNNPLDKGGETYAGISRNSFPTWTGWKIIDSKKVAGQPIKYNTKFPELTENVSNFYNALWRANQFDKIKNQDVANILFDWFINSGSSTVNTKGLETFGVDEILNRDFGFNLPTDSKFDDATINAINSVDGVKLYTIIKNERKKFYETIIKNNPKQAAFAKGWFARLNMFPELKTAAKISAGFLLLLSVIILLTISNK